MKFQHSLLISSYNTFLIFFSGFCRHYSRTWWYNGSIWLSVTNGSICQCLHRKSYKVYRDFTIINRVSWSTTVWTDPIVMQMFVNLNHQNHQLLFQCYWFEYNLYHGHHDAFLLENHFKVPWKAINRSIYKLLNNCTYLSYVAIVLEDSSTCRRALISRHLCPECVYG